MKLSEYRAKQKEIRDNCPKTLEEFSSYPKEEQLEFMKRGWIMKQQQKERKESNFEKIVDDRTYQEKLTEDINYQLRMFKKNKTITPYFANILSKAGLI